MAKRILTERDIEDLARQGVTELEAGEGVYLTDLAREKLEQLGIKLRPAGEEDVGASRAAPGGNRTAVSPSPTLTEAERQQVIERVKSGVIARLGPGVDAGMVDQVVRRVVAQL